MADPCKAQDCLWRDAVLLPEDGATAVQDSSGGPTSPSEGREGGEGKAQATNQRVGEFK